MPSRRVLRRLFLSVAASLPGCTSFHSDPSGAGPAEPRCDSSAPFGQPTNVKLNPGTLQDVGGLRLTPNSQSAYFHATDHTGEHLYVAALENPASFNYLGPIPGSGITSVYYDSDPTVSADGLTLLFARGQGGGLEWHIYWATRATNSDPFPAVNAASGLNSSALVDAHPFLVQGPDHPRLYFDSTRVTQNSSDIYRATWTDSPDDMTVDVSAVDGVNLASSEIAPVVTGDENTMYFASDRTDTTKGNYDIWEAKQMEPGYWTVTRNVSELNSQDYEAPTFVTSNGCRLYFSSNREGTLEMYMASRATQEDGGQDAE